MKSNKLFIPKDFTNFYSQDGGHSLIIRGGPGTGKTTFALQLLEELVDPDKSFYLSTRVSDEALFNQFPWLRKEDMRRRIITSSRILLDEFKVKEEAEEGQDKAKLSKARAFLRSIGKHEPTIVDRTNLSKLVKERRMPEIEILYDRIEKMLPAKPMIVIDSLEGFVNRYDLDMAHFVTTIQKDLVENSNTNLALITECEETTEIEYLVDGVISLSMDDVSGRRFRGLHIIKLRGTQINQPNYLVTLQHGRFRCFETESPDEGMVKGWEAIGDTDTYYSTGIGSLDEILGGGFKKGSYNVIEIGENVSIDEYNLVLRCMIMNFVSQGRGMIGVMSGGTPPDIIRNDLARFIGEEQFDSHVRMADYFLSESEKPYIMALGMRKKEEGLRIWMDNLATLRGSKEKPILDFTGFDTVEYLRGGEVAIRDLFSGVGRIKISEDLGIGITRPGLNITQEIMNMADTYFKIIDLNRYPCIYGIKPKTHIFAIVPDESKGFPYIDLVPIV
jgi:KaiC/GvpD/RAD55 family RecA-like ATPase